MIINSNYNDDNNSNNLPRRQHKKTEHSYILDTSFEQRLTNFDTTYEWE